MPRFREPLSGYPVKHRNLGVKVWKAGLHLSCRKSLAQDMVERGFRISQAVPSVMFSLL